MDRTVTVTVTAWISIPRTKWILSCRVSLPVIYVFLPT